MTILTKTKTFFLEDSKRYNMKFTLDLAPDALQIKPEGAGGNAVSLPKFLENLSPYMPYDSGLIPCSGDGVIAIRKGFGFEQFVYQRKAGIYKVKWGYSERDAKATVHELAHPYRIIIADFQDGNLLGVRHFYSPYSIVSLNDPLYCVNLPNTNTTGYNGTSVGWTCLYRTGDTTKFTPAQRILYAIEREGGLSEPYNDANMSSTDGPRFYKAQGKPSYLYDKVEWEKKTKAEGYDWICSEDLLIPMLVAENTNATTYAKTGKPYTLARAIYEPYSAYYHDKTYTKPINKIFNEGWTSTDALFWSSPVMRALNAGGTTASLGQKAAKPAPVAPKVLADSLNLFDSKLSFVIPNELALFTKEGYICSNCLQHNNYVDGNPTPVYRALGPVDKFVDSENKTIVIKDKTYFNLPQLAEDYWIDHKFLQLPWNFKIVFEKIGDFGSTCNCVAANTHPYTETSLDNTIKSKETINVYQDSFVWSISGDNLLLKVKSTHCDFCDSWLAQDSHLVYDFVPGSTPLNEIQAIDDSFISPCGCTVCVDPTNYASVSFINSVDLITVDPETGIVETIAPSLDQLAQIKSSSSINISLESLRHSGQKFYSVPLVRAETVVKENDIHTLEAVHSTAIFTYINYPIALQNTTCPCGMSFQIDKEKNITSDGPVCSSCNDHGVFYPFFNRIK